MNLENGVNLAGGPAWSYFPEAFLYGGDQSAPPTEYYPAGEFLQSGKSATQLVWEDPDTESCAVIVPGMYDNHGLDFSSLGCVLSERGHVRQRLKWAVNEVRKLAEGEYIVWEASDKEFFSHPRFAIGHGCPTITVSTKLPIPLPIYSSDLDMLEVSLDQPTPGSIYVSNFDWFVQPIVIRAIKKVRQRRERIMALKSGIKRLKKCLNTLGRLAAPLFRRIGLPTFRCTLVLLQQTWFNLHGSHPPKLNYEGMFTLPTLGFGGCGSGFCL
jgi:hypothetical protein